MMAIIAIQMCAGKRSGSRSYTMVSRRSRLNQANSRSTTPLIPFGRNCPSRGPAGESETWMSCMSAAEAKGAPLKPLSPSRSPSTPSAARRGSIGRVPARSSVLAGFSSSSSSEPCLSQTAKILTPLTSWPPSMPRARGRAERAAVGPSRRGQHLIAAGEAPVEGQTLAPPAPQPQPGPAGEAAVQGGEGNTREPAGDAPRQAAEGQGPDQPDQAPPQREIRLAAAAGHADPLPIHGLQLGLDRDDEDLDGGPCVPAVATAGARDTAGRRRWQGDEAACAGARHRPNMVRLGRLTALCIETNLTTSAYVAFRLLRTGPQPWTDQGLVAPDRRLNQAAPSVPCHLAPPRAALLVNEVDVTVSLAWGRVSLSTEN